MYQSFVLTIIGPDRRGLVESLSETIASHGGNWVESRMARLAGQFAGLLEVTVPAEQAAALEQALKKLQQPQDLHIVIQPGQTASPEPTRTLRLELVGHDRPGIVRDLAQALRRRDINVEELTSQSYSAPMSGELLFKTRLQLGVPAAADIDELYHALESLAENLSLDLTYEPQPASE